LFNEIGEHYSPPLPRAAGENARTLGFLHTKAYKSKTNKNFCDFFYFPKGETFKYLQRKNQHSKCAFFAAKSKRAILCACAILCAMVDHLSEQNLGFLMIFFNIFSSEPHLEMEV
jgi:hypothetical protein